MGSRGYELSCCGHGPLLLACLFIFRFEAKHYMHIVRRTEITRGKAELVPVSTAVLCVWYLPSYL